jgi:hypothetical protein
MKYGIREICDVVLKKKASGKFGNLYIDEGMPVIYFDTLKTSSLEGTSTTVYAQGGRGNPRLIAWEGDRTVTFTMEDALISPESFNILSGAGLISASDDNTINVHTTEQVKLIDGGDGKIMLRLSKTPSIAAGASIYVMKLDSNGAVDAAKLPVLIPITAGADGTIPKEFDLTAIAEKWVENYETAHTEQMNKGIITKEQITNMAPEYKPAEVVYVDYYVEAKSGVRQIDIEAGKFGGSYYLEASTLFRDTDGTDHAAEFVIPNCKVQSNFTFTMAPTGDPSTFTFTMDAFPDYTKFDGTKKVIAALQIVEDVDGFGAAEKSAG